MPESNRYKKPRRGRSRTHLILPPLPTTLNGGGPPTFDGPEEPPTFDGTGELPAAGVYLSPTTVPFFTFDENYLNRLRASDPETTAHFHVYFTRLMHSKLRARKLTQHVIDDLVQETFLRALRRIMSDKVREPACLGAYMNGICTNVLHEHYRDLGRVESMNGDELDVADEGSDLYHGVVVNEIRTQVWKILARMSERDRNILKAVILEERDKDEICREHGVDRAYLRVLLHRALRLFKDMYRKH